jgi:hypothetical protein
MAQTMRNFGETIFKFLTCLSLVASIGSFVLAALPLVESGSVEVTGDTGYDRRNGTQSPDPSTRKNPSTPVPATYNQWMEWRTKLIGACLWVIALCAGALTLIRLGRPG